MNWDLWMDPMLCFDGVEFLRPSLPRLNSGRQLMIARYETLRVVPSYAEHDPPIKLYGIPARYANATYIAASKKGQLDAVQRDLEAFQHVRWSRVGYYGGAS